MSDETQAVPEAVPGPAVPPEVQRVEATIGMNFVGPGADLFMVSREGPDGYSTVVVDFEAGQAVRLLFVREYAQRAAAILRWGQLHYYRARGKSAERARDAELLAGPQQLLEEVLRG